MSLWLTAGDSSADCRKHLSKLGSFHGEIVARI